MNLPPAKTCENPACGKTFTKHYKTSTADFARRKYCSAECVKAARALERQARIALKTCPTCRKEFGPPPGKTPAEFARRTYCSQACRARAPRSRPVVPRKPQPVAAPTVAASGQVWRPPGWSPTPKIGHVRPRSA